MKDVRDEVESAYDDISPYFSRKRQRLWPPIGSFLGSLEPGYLIDIGCGTGRVLIAAIRKGWKCVGLDISKGQLDTARSNLADANMYEGFELIRSGMESIPFEGGRFDAACMIASLHHLPNTDSRIEALKESSRVLRNGGKMLVSVWTWDQERFRNDHISRIKGSRQPNDLDGPLPGDFYVPWKDGTVRNRFYHLFGPGELEGEVALSGLIIQRSYFDGRNHWVEAIKY